MLTTLQDQTYWNNTWDTFFLHYQQDTRHAYYIHALVEKQKMLEIGAGSFRDFAKLNELGYDCHAFDYCQGAVDKAKEFFPHLQHKIYQENAFSTSFAHEAYDFTFHNGFWGCFEDAQILLLAQEQMRISKKSFAFTLHNGHNQQFQDYFKKLAVQDPMYTLRFFTLDDIHALTDALGIARQDISIYAVGKGKKYHEDLLIAQGICDQQSLYTSIVHAGMEHLNSSERLLCIVKKHALP